MFDLKNIAALINIYIYIYI